MSNSSNSNAAGGHQHAIRGTEVFVGGLAQSVTESKIREIFSTCGEITEIRMIKDHNGKSKGYCFVRFSTREAAKIAVKDKAGIVLEGRQVGVLPSTEHNSLFLGNLPKEWSADEFDREVRQVFEDVVSANLAMPLSDRAPNSDQRRQNRGFGFVHFSSHAAAARAHKMGSKSDFVLGDKCHPTVQWSEEPEVDPEELAKVKVAFIRNLPLDFSEDFLRNLFGPYGEMEKIVLLKKGQSQVGFVHFARRPDLDNAIKEMNDKTVQGPNMGSFKLLVEVARPLETIKKRAREDPSKKVSRNGSQSKLSKVDSVCPSSGGRVLKVLEEPLVTDPYEVAVVTLPVAVKDRLLRILRLGIATRYDIEIQCLTSLKEIPESSAIAVLDQFLLSGADEIDKGAYLAGLITKYQVRSLGISRVPDHISRSSGRSHVPPEGSFSSKVATNVTRYDGSTHHYNYSDYSLSRVGMMRTVEERDPSPLLQASITSTVEEKNPSSLLFTNFSPSYGRRELKSPVTVGAFHQPMRPQMKFDPFTGEPYKFDPFTGEPIQPERLSDSSRSLYCCGILFLY